MKIIEKIESRLNNRIGIIGAGAWGIGLASHFAQIGFDVYLWCYEEEIYEDILNKNGSGPFLPGVPLSEKIISLKNIQEVFEKTTIIFCTAPMMYLRETLVSVKPFFKTDEHIIISTARGAESETHKLPHEILTEVLGKQEVELFFYGFGRAKDLAMNNFSSGVLAANHPSVAEFLQKKFESETFAINTSSDLLGSIVCSSFISLFPLVFQNLSDANVSSNFTSYFINQCFDEVAEVVRVTGGSIKSILQIPGSIYSSTNLLKSKSDKKGSSFIQKAENSLVINSLAIIPEDFAALVSIINLAQSMGACLPICQDIKAKWLSGSNELVSCSFKVMV